MVDTTVVATYIRCFWQNTSTIQRERDSYWNVTLLPNLFSQQTKVHICKPNVATYQMNLKLRRISQQQSFNRHIWPGPL